MSYFLNSVPQVNQFTKTTKEKYFVDKSELIIKLNELVGTASQYVCVTRPRRFGKTLNAMMLVSYYSKNLNLKDIFDKLDVSKSTLYNEHLNKHNVLYISFNSNISDTETYEEYINFYKTRLIKDIINIHPNVNKDDAINEMLDQVFKETGKGFIFIIDEWDCIFGNDKFSKDDKKNFLSFLENLLKDKSYVELAYMTGILPIAKYSQSSTINMFDEYTFLEDKEFDKYFGFTHEEVKKICSKQNKVSITELKEWYDGYMTQGGHEIYNPRSVSFALRKGYCKNYWTETGSMKEIVYYINNNIDEVKNDIVQMVSGIPLNVHLEEYSAERTELNTRDEILSAMTVYGFLSYHDDTLCIPNKELRMKFDYSIKDHKMGEISKLVLQSNQMLEATINKDTETMERIIQEAHDINIPIIKYNDENSLACVITLVYLNARTKYRIQRESPSGIGFADFIFYPNNKSDPAFIIELKKDSDPEIALQQIKEKRYALSLRDYTGKKLAVGISYDKKLKNHKVKVEDIDQSYYN